eukprot:TRINITY_DN95727_c0_g1_i1.p1 TRINITY_DN95727_c0_g1~~TRINITY_DN95727_c0_g1_i1.p1  ORF type:complete len:517 (-),score=80.89 TRINITY_DN95727_c0_g1_i1:384-1865(-)
MATYDEQVFVFGPERLAELLSGNDFTSIAKVYMAGPRTPGSSNVGGECGRDKLPLDIPERCLHIFQTVFDAAFRLPCLQAVDRSSLFAMVRDWALELLRNPLQPWRRTRPRDAGQEDVIQYTAAQCRGILANAFLGNVLDPMGPFKENQGGLEFSGHYLEIESVGLNKTAALLIYFAEGMRLQGTEDDARIVAFTHRKALALVDFQKLLEDSTTSVLPQSTTRQLVALHNGSMEDPNDTTAFVNFANADFGVGCFINCCTQEEILQMACPEFNVGMLHIGTMEDDEIVVVRNCRRFVEYTGYQSSYNVQGPWDSSRGNTFNDVLTMDAVYCLHFDPQEQLRDIRKAYTCFSMLQPDSCISTGRWGCGAFGGLPVHKFVQQLIAARLADAQLRFSTFGSPDGCDVVLELLKDTPCSVAALWQHIAMAHKGKGALGCKDTGEFVRELSLFLQGCVPHDLTCCSVAKLKAIAHAEGVDISSCIEKSDIIKAVQASF